LIKKLKWFQKQRVMWSFWLLTRELKFNWFDWTLIIQR
jgi:hypothetical protein